ncbi:class I SAM-dependent methyltransferase [Entomospira culicis]|uniref:SAM-dependent methyltransferase n=1 Tax=Entomospira culicis TaxID=2719989 RepID=A0A968KZY6_9SPIO|nr:SAM-dependent methyltransferase [Entomospira culicis]NIZ19309.1 SAM-dependent methyltransferase [Entomospira culicis]NIZ69786.1 SAM-dependent methyltransferase [Entomospira culicis]WDI36897.1 SAM-dependent methyltransferase [Entomospira culicis]WDI38526.1 SAM-dependent methyltransferase [Entomospira culicis]
MYQRFLQELSQHQLHQIHKILFHLDKNEVKKVLIRPILLKDIPMWQIETTRAEKVYHQNIAHVELVSYLYQCMQEYICKQITMTTASQIYHYRLTKKGKILHYAETNQQQKAPEMEHNRTKSYLLEEGMPIHALVDLGIFDGNFRIKASAKKKFRQINHFLSLIVESIETDQQEALTIIDFGCGKSYLSFLVYYYFVFIKEIELTMIGYDLKADVVEQCNLTAKKYDYQNLHFIHGDIAKASHDHGKVDAMITLHACNVATDYALHYAITHQITHIFSVPCCQHEIAQQIAPPASWSFLFQHGLHKERLSALFTDAIRCEILRTMGYQVDVIEFVEIENTPKNALIRAKLTHPTHHFTPTPALQTFLKEFHLKPTLVRLLTE